MTASSVGAELRKYRALAWTLVATLIVSVALFVQFLRIDHVRAEHAFSSSAAYVAKASGMRIELLIERLEAMGREHLLGASDIQLLRLMRSLDVDATLISLCTLEGEAVRVLHAASESQATVSRRCAVDSPSSQSLVSSSDGDSHTIDILIITPPYGNAPSLEFRARDGGSRELRATLSSTALLDAAVLGNAGLDVDSATVCLSLRVGETFHELTCHVGKIAAAVPEAFRAMSEDAAQWVEETDTADLHWRVAVMPNPQTLAGTISLLPFIMFGIALAIGTVACVFAYQAVDKNVLLEARAEELRTRLEQLEQLEEQNGLLDQFAAMAAHDLQAPIRFIVSKAHLLIAELDELDQPELSQMATTQVEQGERMRALVLDLLEFCRAGQSKLTTAPVDTRALVEEEVRLLKAHEEYAGTQIVIGPLPNALICDADKLAQIIRNLLGNAVKFSQGGSAPKVSISAGRDMLHGAWTFRIRDNGPGVDEAHRELIFRPFARLDSGAKGTGMGLAIVKIMLERHGGTIWIDPGDCDGSTFCFTMPGAMPARRSG